MPDTPEFLPFARPSITDAERSAVLEVLDSGWLTTGPRTRDFEARFAKFVRASHAVAVNSATAGLHLALEGIGVGPGDEVIVPTWTFASSAAVVTYLGARPVIVDIEGSSLNMAPEAVLAALTDSTKAVIPVHVAGRPMEIGRLGALLADRGLAVIEDAAHSFPSLIGGEEGGRFAGTVGRAGVFSFYATKTITTGEGGMLVTEDEALADRVRQMSLHGISRGAWDRYAADGSWYYEIEDAGFKYNMTDLAAAIGLAQLGRAWELLAARRSLQRAYEAAFHASRVADLLELPHDAPDGSHAWHLYVIRLHLDRLTIDRAGVMRELQAAGIGASVHFIPLHRHPYYRTRWGTTPGDFPTAEREYPRVISLPIWAGMRETDVERVVATMEGILEARRA
jgi:dTDP-4-amino-4,6-dideoxygalactose transaminase